MQLSETGVPPCCCEKTSGSMTRADGAQPSPRCPELCVRRTHLRCWQRAHPRRAPSPPWRPPGGQLQQQPHSVCSTESPEPSVALNDLVTLIRHPIELMNVSIHQQQNKCTELVKNKTAAGGHDAAAQLTLVHRQSLLLKGRSQPRTSSSNSCSVLEAVKHQDIGLPRAFSFCSQQEVESTKQTLGSRNKALPKQVWIKVGGGRSALQISNK